MDDKQTDKRLRKTYGISLVEWEQLFEKQGRACAICRKPPTGRRLHTEHDHKAHRTKIVAKKDTWLSPAMWHAEAVYNGAILQGESRTKFGAMRQVRELLKRASIRGLCCWPCNRGLRVWWDKPDLMEAAAKYLREFEGKNKQ